MGIPAQLTQTVLARAQPPENAISAISAVFSKITNASWFKALAQKPMSANVESAQPAIYAAQIDQLSRKGAASRDAAKVQNSQGEQTASSEQKSSVDHCPEEASDFSYI